MAKFMALYSSTMSANELMANSSPEQIRASMDEWLKWRSEAESKSVKVDFGLPLQSVSHFTKETAGKSQSKISGYSMLEGDKATIIEMLKSHPQLKRSDATIDLFELLSMPGLDT